jgi:hypothetical protein
VRGEASAVPLAIRYLQGGVSVLGLHWSEPIVART